MSFQPNEKQKLDQLAVDNFKEYLRIPSVQPNVNYDDCVKFLKNQAEGLGLEVRVYEVVPKKPVVVLTWLGKDPKLPSVLLNSHMDVVPVFEDKWTHKPFAAEEDDQGRIFARGAQDMKCVGIQYLEAVRRLKKQGTLLKRTVHLCFVPDEEIGGADGMRVFVNTNEFKNLNVGLALDEGMASPNDEYALFYAERSIWQIHFHCPGTPGHGSLLLKDTAGEKVSNLLSKIFEFRKKEEQKLIDNPSLTIGDVTTLNITQIYGGVQSNVVPPELSIVMDCRIPITIDFTKWEETLNTWCKESGSGIYLFYENKQPQIAPTKLDDTNPYWIAFKQATDSLGLKLKPQVFPGGTDSRYIRGLGVPAIGFSPMNNTPVLLHDHDEFLSTSTFLNGINIYVEIIKSVANVEDRSG